jgi:hypothetical protein
MLVTLKRMLSALRRLRRVADEESVAFDAQEEALRRGRRRR